MRMRGAESRHPLRVCLVSYEFPPSGGGEATYTYNLVNGLAALGHSVLLVVPEGRGRDAPPLPDSARVFGLRSSQAPSLKVLSFMRAVKNFLPRLIRRERVDVTHVAFDYPTIPVGLRGLGSPLVATVHHLHFLEALSMVRHKRRAIATTYLARQFMITRAEARLLRGADGVIAVSDFTRSSILRLGLPSQRVDVVRQGIEPGGFSSCTPEAFRSRFSLDDAPFVLYVGRLEPSKGIEYLISSFAEVRRWHPVARLAVVGRGSPSYVAKLKRRSERGVVFTGYLDNDLLHSAYAGAAAVALPSLMEGLGISLLEAMASSKPCVATTVGGVPEVVKAGETGLLVEPGSPPALARALVELLDDPERAMEMGERGRRLVEEKFSVGQMARATETAYFKAIERVADLESLNIKRGRAGLSPGSGGRVFYS